MRAVSSAANHIKYLVGCTALVFRWSTLFHPGSKPKCAAMAFYGRKNISAGKPKGQLKKWASAIRPEQLYLLSQIQKFSSPRAATRCQNLTGEQSRSTCGAMHF